MVLHQSQTSQSQDHDYGHSDIPKGYTAAPPQGTSAWSTSSDKQLGSPASSVNDRVFPIRSVVSVDPSQTPYSFSGRGSNSGEANDYFPRPPSVTNKDAGGRSGHCHSDSDGKMTLRQRDPAEPGADKRKVDRKSSTSTTRSDYRGSRMQQFLDNASDNSVNTHASTRFKHIVTTEGHAIITGRDGNVLQTCEDEPIHIPGAIQGFGLLIATIRIEKVVGSYAHNPVNPEMIICEFELDDDPTYPLVPEHEDTPEPPEDTLNSNPTKEEFDESTVNSSKPLRVLRNARKRKGEAAAMEVFNIMSQVQEQLATAHNLELFLKILVGVVKELTGFHRVMIYQFDATYNGRVVTELVDPRATKDLYKGLNFPASDIPKQARELYKINKVRLLYDRDLQTARLVCRGLRSLKTLSIYHLLIFEPCHLSTLNIWRYMAVRSSMSISINAFGELWGLIACHTYGAKGMRVSFPIRKMCRLVGDTASRNIERLSYASRLHARKLINTVPTEANPSGYIIASSDDLLKLFDADFGLLSIKGETKILGKVDQSHEALAMLEYMRMRKIKSVMTSQDIKQDFPDLRYPPGFNFIAGQIRNVKWAGNPYEKFIKEGTEGYLEPRRSFKTWNETVIGKCREWTEEQVETAAVLCLVYGKFIEVWRQKEAALQNSQLTRLLLANSAHEVRTPLNAIINYLEIALEGALDQDTRDNLAKSHSASKSLIYVINDLLDLTKTEEGMDLVKDEIFDLPAAIREATDLFNGDVKRKFVHGDQRRVRQAVANITANAVQNTSRGFVHVDVWLQEIINNKVNIEIVVEDSGAGMSNQKLDTLFRDLEQVDGDPLSWSSNGRQSCPEYGWPAAIKVEVGKGSRFVIQLPFVLPYDDSGNSGNKEKAAFLKTPSMSPSIASPLPQVPLNGVFPSRGPEIITDTKTPVKAVRIPDEFSGSMNDNIPPSVAAKVKFSNQSSSSSQSGNEDEPIPNTKTHNAEHLKVLVAEDDPVNSRIINKRLEKGGHEVFHTINGEECASAYGDNIINSSKSANTSSSPTTRFDVVLMDMQMPIVDGLTSAKMIRSFEKTHLDLSPRAKLNGRVPIFARSRIVLVPTREWEHGGWFHKMQPSALQSSTAPSNETPVRNPPQIGPEAPQPENDSLDSDTGSSTPRDDKRRPLIYDERLNAANEALNATVEVDIVSNEEVTPTARQSIPDGADKCIEDITAATIVNDPKDSGPTADSYLGADASNVVDQLANSTTVDGPSTESTNDAEITVSTG
ncbi:hypothetical protein DID88_008007 [Monilinia fructigena]|uniref:Response regulatory domain-containing protein n=1 Tax=Monilinia fructigena TaxID=38457 RepID=A0A395J4M5_9HELO|nr:hypothetical protein DID88_008007 [Monilinia fructigena]